ncbi:PE-PPE domain-containing protein [Mycobacterium sp. Root265]|uniref:PE-PPE domain-containing protein n=1 Tax=Mycobacterium sp. Root265 TaxID=1736504 RepID=UPI000ADFA1B3|nr:PE-PPE domain-containing protein [Mycobacterium sp. Root265]
MLPRRDTARWRGTLAVLSAAVVLVAAPSAYAGQSRIGINGARPSDLPGVSDVLGDAGFTQDGWLHHASNVGSNWLPGMTPVPLNYPAQLGPLWGTAALSGDRSLAAGQAALHTAILAELAKGNTVSVAGLSLGTMVIDREIAHLQGLSESEAPPRGSVTFYVFGGESRGFGQMYARGVTVPLIGVTFHTVPDSRYDTVVVYGQWDGWAAPPDRPWNALAVINAVMGALYTVNGSNDHSRAAMSDLDDAVLVSDVTNTLGGRVTTYMIPEASLPITRPLRQLGVPGAIVDRLNELLLPWIRAGYSGLTPGLGLRFDNGRLLWTAPPAPAIAAPVTGPSALMTADTNDSRADRPTPLRESFDVASQDVPDVPRAEDDDLIEDDPPTEQSFRRELADLDDTPREDSGSVGDLDEPTSPASPKNDVDAETAEDVENQQDSPVADEKPADPPADAAA